jgi:Site-specific recombinases, DNA invertase Pin homologs
MVGILAELERSLIQERPQAGRAAAQARGVKMGRKPLLSALQVTYVRTLLERGARPVHVAQLLRVSWRTLERALSSAGV